MLLIGNILWFIFGGVFIFLGYLVGGIVLCFTIIGIPWGIQCLKLSLFALFPFGSDTRETYDGPSNVNVLMNVIWLIFGGVWIVLNHLLWGLVLSISIIGLPFGLQHLKMVRLAITPFGREIYDIDN